MKYLFLILFSFNVYADCSHVTSTPAISLSRAKDRCKCDRVIDAIIALKASMSEEQRTAVLALVGAAEQSLGICDIPMAVSRINSLIADGTLIKQSDKDGAIAILSE